MITEDDALRAARRSMRGAFSWGDADCASAACAAFALLHGVDPLGPVRGTYDTAAGAWAIVAAAGGYQPWCAARFAEAGLVESDAPGSGDLVMVPGREPFGLALALCIRPGLAVLKGEGGPAFWWGTMTEGWTCLS